MSVVHLIDTLVEWARPNICERVQLKQPPKDLEAAEDAGYDYKLVNPMCFGMYIPTAEKLAPGVHSPYPALCVRFLEGTDALDRNERAVEVQLCFAAWDPGTHGKDMFDPDGKGGSVQWDDGKAADFFERTGEGWRSLWNFADVAIRAVESAVHIGGYAIDRAAPVRFGPLSEQEGIPDFYPMWYAGVSFRVLRPITRNISSIQNLL